MGLLQMKGAMTISSKRTVYLKHILIVKENFLVSQKMNRYPLVRKILSYLPGKISDNKFYQTFKIAACNYDQSWILKFFDYKKID